MPLLLLLLALVFAASGGAPSSGAQSYNTSVCLQNHRCGRVDISYPFYLHDEAAVLLGSDSMYCGYPGLGIQCKDGEQAVLQLGGDSYRVSKINYTDFTVSLVDQEFFNDESCPRVDHNVTLPQLSWLSYPDNTVDHYLLFFLNCTLWPINVSPISCDIFAGQTAGPSFVLPGDEVPPGAWTCRGVFKVPIRLQPPDGPTNDSRWINGGYANSLRSGFQLELNKTKKPPACAQCEISGGKCAYTRPGDFMGCLCSSSGRVESQNCTTDSSGSGKPFKACILTF
jgi:hypothetical protein